MCERNHLVYRRSIWLIFFWCEPPHTHTIVISGRWCKKHSEWVEKRCREWCGRKSWNGERARASAQLSAHLHLLSSTNLADCDTRATLSLTTTTTTRRSTHSTLVCVLYTFRNKRIRPTNAPLKVLARFVLFDNSLILRGAYWKLIRTNHANLDDISTLIGLLLGFKNNSILFSLYLSFVRQ